MTDTSCELVYDLAAMPYGPWSLYVCGALIVLTLLWVLFRKRIAELSFRKYPRGIEFLAFAVALIAGVSIVGSSYWTYYSLLRSEREGTAQSVNGIVTKFQRATPANRNFESFNIGATHFEYFKDDGGPGFRGDGTVLLQNGMRAEAVTVNGTIVRLKVCR